MENKNNLQEQNNILLNNVLNKNKELDYLFLEKINNLIQERNIFLSTLIRFNSQSNIHDEIIDNQKGGKKKRSSKKM